jgi:adenine-specific DNA-methyltransferase
MDIRLDQRRHLRKNATDSETALWRHLRARRFGGFKFRKQHPCGPYILDFYCAQRRLAIELDGGQHYLPRGLPHDARRDDYLAARGITVLRFGADLIFRDRDAVLGTIAAALGIEATPPPAPAT